MDLLIDKEVLELLANHDDYESLKITTRKMLNEGKFKVAKAEVKKDKEVK